MKGVIATALCFGKSRPKRKLFACVALLLSALLAAGLCCPFSVAAAGKVEYVVNGGFETGDFSSWNVTIHESFPEVQEDRVNSGDHAALMGDAYEYNDGERAALIEQEVTLPSGAEGPFILKFDYMVDDEDDPVYDYLKVLINGEEIFSTYEYSDGWQTYEFDLDNLAEPVGEGETFTLTVVCWTEDNYYTVNYYVDNFSLVVDGVELIENGGFETGDFSGWDVTVSGLFPKVQGDEVSGGNYAAHMSDGGEGMYFSRYTAAIAQEISLPAWAEDPLLQLAFLVEFAEGIEDVEFHGNEWGWLEVLVDDQQVLYACSESNGWQDHEYDLSEYIGKTFTLTVRSVLDVEAMWDWENENESDAFPINFYVDDISITASEVDPEEPGPTEPEPEEPKEQPKKKLPQTGGGLPIEGLLALGLLTAGAALLKLRRK